MQASPMEYRTDGLAHGMMVEGNATLGNPVLIGDATDLYSGLDDAQGKTHGTARYACPWPHEQMIGLSWKKQMEL